MCVCVCVELHAAYRLCNNDHSELARDLHTNGLRDVPRCGALSLLQKPLHYKGGMAVVPRPLFAAALVVRRRYLIKAPRPFPATPLVVRPRYLIVVPRPMPAAPRRNLIVMPRPCPRRRSRSAKGKGS